VADDLRARIGESGYSVRDTREGPWPAPRDPEAGLTVISSANDVPDATPLPDAHGFSVSLLAKNSHDDLVRCLASIAAHSDGHDLEIVILDNGSTDETLGYLRELARSGVLPRPGGGASIPVRVIFGDHDLGFAIGRTATMRASRGRLLVWMDTSIELHGDVWELLESALDDPAVGMVGPYGLVTNDLREFAEASGPNVDAIEGYLMAFRRALVPEVGWLDEKYRFYRLADITYSFFFKTAGYRVLALPAVAARLVRHPHREWFSLTAEEQATKSKKNYDLFRARWHHGQSLLTSNYDPRHHWLGHDHAQHLGGRHQHERDEIPSAEVAHDHDHHHWPDHSHSHAHIHDRA